MRQTEHIVYPSIVVDIGDSLFSVDSSRVKGILQLNGYRKLPDVPAEIRGIFKNRDKAVVLVDMRIALNMDSLESKYLDFCHMIDDRKQDHIRWVNALKQTVINGVPFTLATNAHQCALGKWVDQFYSDIGEVNLHLKKLMPPHESLHHSAIEILDLMADGNTHREKIVRIYNRVKETYMPTVLELLEQMKEIFHQSVFREMVLTINDDHRELGIIVDKVFSVEELSPVDYGSSHFQAFLDIPCIKKVQVSEKIEGLILEIDIDALLNRIGKLQLPEQ